MNVMTKRHSQVFPTDASDAWKVLNRKEIFTASPWLSLSVEELQMPDGKIIEDFYHLDIPDFVVIFAETAKGGVITLRQYKHGVGRSSLTLPGGQVESIEAPLDAAKRELLEETGYQAPFWRHLGSYTVNGNLGCGKGHFFMATGAKRIQDPNSGDLEEMEIQVLKQDALKKSMADGDVILLNHACAISLAFQAKATS